MSKRTAEESDEEVRALKSGQRPMNGQDGDEAQEFEDEYEDEFESEDEIFEAGVDGRPDEEREAEERESAYIRPERHIENRLLSIIDRWHGRRPGYLHSRAKQIGRWTNACA